MAIVTDAPGLAAVATRDVASRALTITMGVVAGCAIVLPRALPIGMGILAVMLVVATLQRTIGPASPIRLRSLADEHGITLAMLALAIFAALSAIWSPAPKGALVKASWLTMLVLSTAVASRLVPLMPAEARTRAARAVAAGCALGCAYVTWEVLRNQELGRLVFNSVSWLHPGPSKHVTLENGAVVAIGPWVMNRNVGALNLLLWPSLACLLLAGLKRGTAAALAVLLVAATALASMRSWHESSQIAIVMACGVFAVARLHLPAGRILVLAGWTAAALAMLPFVMLVHKAGLHTATSIPESGQARIILWNFTATKYLEKPIVGVGASATKSIDEDLKPATKRSQGQQPYAERTGQHAHNIFVQIWFELGAIGALIFFVSGVMAWRTIGRLPRTVQPFALAGATSAMCIGALTWGFWQEWYLSLFALAAIATMTAAGAAGAPAGRAAHQDGS